MNIENSYKEVVTPTEAYRQGWVAYLKMFPKSSNPFESKSPEWVNWMMGYEEAKEDDD